MSIKTIENKSEYSFDEMVGLAARENNKKRGYLFVNRFQAKHVPVFPVKALSMFHQLARELPQEIYNQKVTCIAFAETATAIGAHIAAQLGEDTCLLQTTREEMPAEHRVVHFEEEHSHATTQQLFCKDRAEVLEQAEHILFVEDELSTGKTIENFISALNNKGIEKRFSVASILNSMTDDRLDAFKRRGVNVYYLMRFSHDIETDGAFQSVDDPDLICRNSCRTVDIPGKQNPRTGVFAQEYLNACLAFCHEVVRCIKPELLSSRKILVLGTEEFMYPAIVCADLIKKKVPEASVVTHATSRSPIVPKNEAEYPLHNRFKIESVYEKGRSTYVYNIVDYDEVIVLTDSDTLNQNGADELAGALYQAGNKSVHFFRWVN